jgi:hypothetical protein
VTFLQKYVLRMPPKRLEWRCKWPGCTHPAFEGQYKSQYLDRHQKQCQFCPANIARAAAQAATETTPDVTPVTATPSVAPTPTPTMSSQAVIHVMLGDAEAGDLRIRGEHTYNFDAPVSTVCFKIFSA